MDFTFLFAAIAALTFKLQFDVDDEVRQDYFLFHGKEQSAHLHRQNQTLVLQLIQGESNEVYEMALQAAETEFYFSWFSYMVNENPMMMIKGKGKITAMEFDHFTFISPIVRVITDYDDYDCEVDTYYDIKEINYWFIVGIAFAVTIICKSTQVTRKAVLSFLKKNGLLKQSAILLEDIITDPESDYEIMEVDVDLRDRRNENEDEQC